MYTNKANFPQLKSVKQCTDERVDLRALVIKASGSLASGHLSVGFGRQVLGNTQKEP